MLAQLAGSGPFAFGSAAARARPYAWAQELAGCDPIPSLPPGAGGGEARAGGLEAARGGRVAALLARLRAAASAR